MSGDDDTFGVHLGIDLELADGAWGALFGDACAVDLMTPTLPRVERIGCLPGGMASGRPAVELAVRLPDGRVVIAETSWRALALAVRALEVRHPIGDGS